MLIKQICEKFLRINTANTKQGTNVILEIDFWSHLSRDEWIPLFSDIRILGYLGYWFFLDTWISGYLDIMDIWIHGYLDTWISVFFGYMDIWILWISIFFIIQILDILSKYPDIFGYFFKLPYVEKRQLNSSVKII